MTTEIKHADLIRAALDGKVIEGRVPGHDWSTYEDPQWAISSMLCRPHLEFRIKPEPIVQWAVIERETVSNEFMLAGSFSGEPSARWYLTKAQNAKLLRLEFDADLTEVKATLEAP